MTLFNVLAFFAAAIVLYKTLYHISCLSHKDWTGRKMEFAVLSMSHALQCAGAVGVAFGSAMGAMMLLLGLAGVQIIDRRNRSR